LTKAGEAGADVLSGSVGGGAVAMARPRLYDADVLTARFFKFLGRFAGVTGRAASTAGRDRASDFEGSRDVKREAFMAKLSDCGDWGDGPGEGSVMEDESREAVVVGEDSVESEAEVEVLFLGWWKGAKEGGTVGVNARWTSGGGARGEPVESKPWRPTGAQAGSRTWMKDGSGSTKAGEGGDCMMGER
jgi:hypothetical protein